MTKEIPRKRIVRSSKEQKAAQEREKPSPGGLHFGDYRPRYREAYNIYEKAKEHARNQKKKILKKDEKSC